MPHCRTLPRALLQTAADCRTLPQTTALSHTVALPHTASLPHYHTMPQTTALSYTAAHCLIAALPHTASLPHTAARTATHLTPLVYGSGYKWIQCTLYAARCVGGIVYYICRAAVTALAAAVVLLHGARCRIRAMARIENIPVCATHPCIRYPSPYSVKSDTKDSKGTTTGSNLLKQLKLPGIFVPGLVRSLKATHPRGYIVCGSS
jgi:hypothetical protein